MTASEDGYIFLNSVELECPDCHEQTRYRRDGHDGEDGEGQYCGKCKKYVLEAGMRMMKFSQFKEGTGFVVGGKNLKFWKETKK